MALWRAAAIERLPELRDTIASAPNVMFLWIELGGHFATAYRDPRNDDLISRIYAYADWCADAPRNDDAGRDPSTAVTVAFYEHIATNPAARDDMPRWFRFDEVSAAKATFGHLLNEEEFRSLLGHMQRNKANYRPRGQRQMS